jgi:hypothetical protein
MISYQKNCEELIRLHQTAGSPAQLLALFDLTYQGRRNEIQSGLFNDEEIRDGNFTAEEVIVRRCPLFRQSHYVSNVADIYMFLKLTRLLSLQLWKEMNNIFSSNIVNDIGEKWAKMVPVILSLAKKKKYGKYKEAIK